MVVCKFANFIRNQHHHPYLYACHLKSGAICPYKVEYNEQPTCNHFQPKEEED